MQAYTVGLRVHVLRERVGSRLLPRRLAYVDQSLKPVFNETGRVQSSCAFRQSGSMTFSDVVNAGRKSDSSAD